VALVRPGFSEELVACIFRVENISELGTALAVTSRHKHIVKKHYTRKERAL
jgi:hypothetical protein